MIDTAEKIESLMLAVSIPGPIQPACIDMAVDLLPRAASEIKELRALVLEVMEAARGDIRRDPGPAEILAERGWYKRAAVALFVPSNMRHGD